VLNEQSSRKTPASFTFKDGILLYGSDARNLETKQPDITYKQLWPLMGVPYGDQAAEAQRKFHSYELVELDGGYAVHVAGMNGTLPVEVMVGFVMGYVRDIASKYLGHSTKDCVITIPPFWTHHQRQAVLDAAKIGGLSVLALLNQPTALGINFASARKDLGNESHVVFYDMGSATSTVSLLHIQVNSTGKQPVSTVHVLDFAWEEGLGGREFDLRIADYIVEDVKAKKGYDVSRQGNKRAFAKILKESLKVKEVLSANIETGIGIEGLVEDYDYRGHITRTKFEEISSDLIEKAVAPLSRLLNDNEEVPKESIQFIETFGGGTVTSTTSLY